VLQTILAALAGIPFCGRKRNRTQAKRPKFFSQFFFITPNNQITPRNHHRGLQNELTHPETILRRQNPFATLKTALK